jgi:hypothetical protein
MSDTQESARDESRESGLPRVAAVDGDGGDGTGAASGEAWINRRATARATRAAQARNASARRRLVDPATCERDYSRDEVEFMNAMAEYKKRSGRMFPTWSEVLEVLSELGYKKHDEAPPRGAAAV